MSREFTAIWIIWVRTQNFLQYSTTACTDAEMYSPGGSRYMKPDTPAGIRTRMNTTVKTRLISIKRCCDTRNPLALRCLDR